MSAALRSGPKLSFVVVSRNDDHGGNLKKRMQLFVSGLMEQCRRHRVSSELIVVEWNPPEDRPGLAEALHWPDSDGYCTVRIIHVPPEIHRRFKYSDRMAVFQMIGKNVGIRRARGEFVLATNVDLLFSNELFEFFASGRLETGKIYRIDRYDVCEDIPQEKPLDEQLEYCGNHLIRVCCGLGTFDLSPTGEILPEEAPGVEEEAEEGLRHRLKALAKSKKWLQPALWAYRLPYRMYRFARHQIALRLMGSQKLHTNASGDFTLMSKHDWLMIRGYCEYAMYSMHLDSLQCYSAALSGVREVVLADPMRVYHMEHAPGSGWQPGKGGDLLYRRLRDAGIPVWTDLGLKLHASWMYFRKNPTLYNAGKGWGLADESLPETVIGESHEERKQRAVPRKAG